MSTSMRIVTAEELLRMTGEGRRELVRGELRTMAPAGFDHGVVTMNLARLLANHVRANQLGVVLGAETGFRLSRNPDTVRGADVAFVSAKRMPAGSRPQGYWEGGPDLAVEVVSPSDTVSEVDDKVGDYLAAGTQMIVVVNPCRKTVTVHRPDGNVSILREPDVFDAGDVVPGFTCKLTDIFV